MIFNDKKKKLTPRQFDAELERLVKWVKESVSPFESDTPAKQRARVRRAREDQDFFNETYLPHYFTQPGADFHREAEELAEEGERQERFVAIAAPRGHAKSTRFTFARPLKKILFKEKKFVVVMGEDQGLTEGTTVSIRTELEVNPRILHDFGAQKTKEWAAGEFVTRGGTKVWARTWREGVRGLKFGPHRIDMLILDDMEDDKIARNSDQVKKILAVVNEEVSPAMEPHRGQVFWVGTILSKKCAFSQVMDNPEWISKIYRAIEDPVWDEEHAWNAEQGRWLGMFTAGVALWPARWNLERLSRERRRIGSPAFKKEYQNDPEDDDSMFKRSWIRRIKWDALPNVALYPYAGRDPSLKHKTTSDFKAHVSAARGTNGLVYVRYASIKRISRDRMVKEDFTLVPRFGVLQIGVELDGWQELLRPDYDREAVAQGFHLPIIPIERHGVSKDDEIRIGGLSSPVEGGIIIFCEGPPAEVGDMELLIEQLIDFEPKSSKHDDGPDALEIAYHLAERRRIGKPHYERVAQREAQFEQGAW